MAGGGVAALGVNTERAAQYKGRMTLAVAMTCLVAAVGGAIFGYDIGISGGVTSMDPFLQKFFPAVFHRKNSGSQNNYCKYDNQGLAAFTSSLYLAGLVASLAASPVTRNYGRKASIVCGGVSFLVGATLNVAAVNLAMLILGRIMLGVGIGFGNQAVPLYLSEMAPAHLRGGLNMMFQLATTLGIFTANLINYGTQNIKPWGWRLSLGLAAAPATLMTLGGLLLPETPNSLIERGRVEEGAARAGAHPRHGRRGRRVHGHGGGERAGQHHRAPVPEHPGAAQPAAAGDGRVHAGVPDPDGHQLHPLLRAGAVPEHGLRRQRVALRLRAHRRRALLLHAHLHRHRRPPRPPEAPHQRRHPDDRLPGDRGGDPGREVRGGQAAVAELLDRGGGGDLPVRAGVRVVVGPAGVDGAERDLPAGDEVGGAEHHGGGEPALHLRHRAGVPVAAVRLQVRHLPLLRGVDHRHDRLRLRLPPGDQGRAHRGDGAALEEALVLEEGHAGHAARGRLGRG